MNRVSLRTTYVGAEPTLRGQTGWAHRPEHAPGEAWEFEADSGVRITCNHTAVAVWLGANRTANAS